MAEPLTDYRAALDWLFGFADWERGIGWSPSSNPDEKWKLGRTRALLDLIGSPDRALRSVLVAGTKGKGSTAAMLESIARAGSWKTGLYTQPHLHSYRERIRLNGEPIDQASFVAAVRWLKPLVHDLQKRYPDAGEPTTFELTTVLALLVFKRARVDLAILEVGLGGRLDATNVLDPLVSIITPIGLDHTEILGETIEEIAREKAGIIHAGGRVVSALQRRAARGEIVTRCSQVGATCRFVGPLPPASEEDGSGQNRALVRVRRSRPVAASIALRGAHQRQNAAVAVAAALGLVDHGLALSPATAAAGLERVRWPGRLEIHPGRPTIVIDAAHTPESSRALARGLLDERVSRPRWLVVGMLRGKNVRGFAQALRPVIDGVVATTTINQRAISVDEMAAACRAAGAPDVTHAPSVAEAIDRAARLAGPHGSVIATGSFSVVSEAREALGLAQSDA